MTYVDEHQYLPDVNRLSVLAATILLAYALTPFVNISEREWVLNLPGVFFLFRLNFTSLISVLVAVLAAVGTDWLLRDHPQLSGQTTFQHWILPGLSAWAIGLPLGTLEIGLEWWAVFAFGGLMLVLVFAAEYIVVDLSDARNAPATVGLTAVSFALYLILAIAVRAAGLRLYLLLPTLVFPIALVALRSLYLRLGGHWKFGWSIAIALVIAQFAVGLHYWPVSPLAYGLILVGPAYALTSIAGSFEEGRSWSMTWIEPLLMLIVMWGLALAIEL